jgi:hypothetical protein
MKRALVFTAAVVLVGVAWTTEYNGEVRAVEPSLALRILGSAGWSSITNIAANDADPDILYVMVPEMPEGELFAAVRVNVRTGAQTRETIEIHPLAPGRSTHLVRGLRARVRGLWFQRPSFYLFRVPDGHGPGFERVDSASGVVDIVIDQAGGTRTLLTQPAYNSSRIVFLLSRVFAHPDGQWIAAVLGDLRGWDLFVFTAAPPGALRR